MKNKHFLVAIMLLLLLCSYTIAQPTIGWQKIVPGKSGAIFPNGTSFYEKNDSLFYSNGISLHFLPGTKKCKIRSCIRTSFGSYIIAADIKNQLDKTDACIVHVDSTGNILWNKKFGGSNNEQVGSDISLLSSAIVEDASGFTFTATTFSNDGDVSGNHTDSTTGQPSQDIWVVHLDLTGNLVWQKCFGGSKYDNAYSISKSTSGFLVSARTGSSLPGFHTGNGSDGLLIKLDSLGNLLWQKCFGGSDEDRFYFAKELSNGEILAAGETNSLNGDISGRPSPSTGWFMKISSSGNIVWQRYAGVWLNTISADTAVYMAGGTTTSNNAYILAVTPNGGNLLWQKTFGGTADDRCFSIEKKDDTLYALCRTASSNGDVVGNTPGTTSLWLVAFKLITAPLASSDLRLTIFLQKDIVKLRWNSATNQLYEIQRSSDTRHWENISSTIASSFDDTHPLEGVSYYRLKVLEKDGSFSYSNIGKIIYRPNAVRVFPTVTQSTCTISGITSGEKVQVYSTVGQLLFSKISSGNSMDVDLSKYPAGMYVIVVNNFSTKVIKQ